jgi:hypothetical protein
LFFYTNATIIIAKPIFGSKYIPDYVESQGLDYGKSIEKSVSGGNMRVFLACGNFLVETT